MSEYRIKIAGLLHEPSGTSPDRGVAESRVKRILDDAPIGTEGSVEMRESVLSPWLPCRAYVVDPDGGVRRTDRTVSPATVLYKVWQAASARFAATGECAEEVASAKRSYDAALATELTGGAR